jgi:hypothetical protein
MKSITIAVVVALSASRSAVPQTVEVQEKPRAIVVKDAMGYVAASIPMSKGERIVARVSSLDKKFLFIATDEHGAGALNAINLAEHTNVTRSLVNNPTKFLRLGPRKELWALGKEMQSISETGEVTGSPIILKFEGYPSEVIDVGPDHVAMTLANPRRGGSLYRVALMDLKERKVDGVIETRSAGEKAGLASGHFGNDLLKGMARSAATLGTDTAGVHTTYLDYFLIARPDGRFLYALDFGTHKVAVIDVQSTTTVTTIELDKAASKAQLSRDGKELIITGTQVQKIDLDSNKIED